jgi:hypothetical protein
MITPDKAQLEVEKILAGEGLTVVKCQRIAHLVMSAIRESNRSALNGWPESERGSGKGKPIKQEDFLPGLFT